VSARESVSGRSNELAVISAEHFQNLYQHLAMHKSLLSRFLYIFGAFFVYSVIGKFLRLSHVSKIKEICLILFAPSPSKNNCQMLLVLKQSMAQRFLQEQSSGVSKTVILMLSPLCPKKSLLILSAQRLL
jgi:hypothetical protein